MGQSAHPDGPQSSGSEEELRQISHHSAPYQVFNMMPTLSLPPMEQGHVVLAGFQDCTEEAIRYLVDVEQFSEEDPLVLGLKQHLWERQQQLDIQRILFGNSTVLVNNNLPGVPSSSSSPSATSSTRTSGVEHGMEELLAPTPGGVHSPAHSAGSASPGSEVDPMEISMRSEGSEAGDYSVPQMTVITPPGSHQSENSEQGHVSEEDLSHSVLNLAMLAQNNPAIASLTEEILSLLESEDELTDSEDHNETGEEVDQGDHSVLSD